MVPAAARAQADAARNGFLAGNFAIFKGPIKDNKGNTVIPPGTVMGEHDPVLEGMGYMVAGVVGSAS
jgi:simple sugar transport system substrate-binding protein